METRAKKTLATFVVVAGIVPLAACEPGPPGEVPPPHDDGVEIPVP